MIDQQAMQQFGENLGKAYDSVSVSGPMAMGANIPHNPQTGKSYFDGFNPVSKGLMDTIYPAFPSKGVELVVGRARMA